MLNKGIAKTLVHDIPGWIPVVDITPTINSVYNVVQRMPDEKEVPALFNEDVWDFSPLCPVVRSYLNKLDFNKCKPEYKTMLKVYALEAIENGTNIRSIHCFIGQLAARLDAIIAKAGCMELITEQHIIEEIDQCGIKYSGKAEQMRRMILLLESAETCGIFTLTDMDALTIRLQQYRDLAKHEDHKPSSDIPEDYFCRLITMFNRVMRDETASLDRRLSAGIFLINSQLGLRTAEIPILKTDCLRYTDTINGVKPYIIYTSTKSAKGFMNSKRVEHMCTPLLESSIKYYLELREQCPTAKLTDILYVLPQRQIYPVSREALNDQYFQLLRDYFPEIRKPYPSFDPCLEGRKGNKKLYWYPKVYCFRVHVFSTLLNQGVPRSIIEKIMSHTPTSNCDDSYYGGVKTPSGSDVSNEMNLR